MGRAPPDCQRDDRGRGGLLPGLRVRAGRGARPVARVREPRGSQHRPPAGHLRRVRRPGHVLRARLGGGTRRVDRPPNRGRGPRGGLARLRSPAGLRPDAGGVPRGRAARAARSCRICRASRSTATALRVSRSPKRSLWALDVLSRKATPTTPASSRSATTATAFPTPRGTPFWVRVGRGFSPADHGLLEIPASTVRSAPARTSPSPAAATSGCCRTGGRASGSGA